MSKRLPKRAPRRVSKAPSHKTLALSWGEAAKLGITHGVWFGPKGEDSLCKIPIANVVKLARRSAHHALKHRARYPLRAAA